MDRDRALVELSQPRHVDGERGDLLQGGWC
jgi:hypothetical protein